VPREAKPYLERGWWISRPAGQYIRLCREEEGRQRAKELLNEHLIRIKREKQQEERVRFVCPGAVGRAGFPLTRGSGRGVLAAGDTCIRG
jgi:hypothetical protein